jgi:hypothetical protein
LEEWGEEKGDETVLLKNKQTNKQTKNNSIEDLVGNEKSGYTVPDTNKTIINVTNEPSDAHKKKIPQTGNHERNHRETLGEAI